MSIEIFNRSRLVEASTYLHNNKLQNVPATIHLGINPWERPIEIVTGYIKVSDHPTPRNYYELKFILGKDSKFLDQKKGESWPLISEIYNNLTPHLLQKIILTT